MDESIQNFINKSKIANSMGTNEIRLSIQEAVGLSLAINEILVAHMLLNNKIQDLENLIGSSIKMDGGKL